MTNWMGDDGFLRNATCKIRRHNPAGDILFIKGKVKRSGRTIGRRATGAPIIYRLNTDSTVASVLDLAD